MRNLPVPLHVGWCYLCMLWRGSKKRKGEVAIPPQGESPGALVAMQLNIPSFQEQHRTQPIARWV